MLDLGRSSGEAGTSNRGGLRAEDDAMIPKPKRLAESGGLSPWEMGGGKILLLN